MLLTHRWLTTAVRLSHPRRLAVEKPKQVQSFFWRRPVSVYFTVFFRFHFLNFLLRVPASSPQKVLKCFVVLAIAVRHLAGCRCLLPFD